MIAEVGNRHKIGIVRAVKGMASLADQSQQLVDAGVEPNHIWQTGKDNADEIANAFRQGDDVLVACFIGALGKDYDLLLAAIGKKDADFYDLETQTLFRCRDADQFSTIKRAMTYTQSVPGRAAAKAGAKSGPKPKLNPTQKKAAKAAWEGQEGSNQDVASQFGVSVVYLHREFGSRTDARARASKR